MAERLALRERAALAVGSVWPQVSIGVAWSERDRIAANALVAKADAAMYQSKRKGEGRPERAWGLAGDAPITSPVALVRGASADRSLRNSSGQARSLRSA